MVYRSIARISHWHRQNLVFAVQCIGMATSRKGKIAHEKRRSAVVIIYAATIIAATAASTITARRLPDWPKQ